MSAALGVVMRLDQGSRADRAYNPPPGESPCWCRIEEELRIRQLPNVVDAVRRARKVDRIRSGATTSA